MAAHSEVFRDQLGTLKGTSAKINVDPMVQPIYCKARSVPYAMKEKVNTELDRLQAEGIIEPVQYADWAAPIVPILKSDKVSVRICGDYKLTVNKASRIDNYPIPKIADIFSTLAGGKMFTKLDMSQAYQQLRLDEESKQYVVINTHRGLFRYNRLPYGIASAPGIFQRTIEGVLRDIPGVSVYLDDILITGSSEEEHLATLDKVLSRLRDAGLQLRKEKCWFLAPSVIYLGHRIDAEGLHPIADKVTSLKQAPAPRNVTELQSYLGLINYYRKFLPDLSRVLAPLYALLQKGQSWSWTSKENEAFENSKKLLTHSSVLTHDDQSKELILSCDTSAYGLGAVLSQVMEDGSEKPIGFASRTLSEAEKKYAQIEKEGLACVFGVKKFHSYLYGRHFTLVTDHKPLLGLLSEGRAIPPHASARIQRWALTLAMYEYTFQFKRTEAHANADAMSRLPLPNTAPKQTPLPPETVLMLEHLNESPIAATQIATWTRRDPSLSKVLTYSLRGWPQESDDALKPYFQRRQEITVQDGCLLWGNRVIVPIKGRKQMLSELHGTHVGAARMKSLASATMWWPKMDQEIDEVVKQCAICQESRPIPPKAPLQPWAWPSKPWSRVHIDYAGPFLGHMFLIIVDAHSKWIEAHVMNTSTSAATIQKLRKTFSQFGIPEMVVSDNGTSFTSEQFKTFMEHFIQISHYPTNYHGAIPSRAIARAKASFTLRFGPP